MKYIVKYREHGKRQSTEETADTLGEALEKARLFAGRSAVVTILKEGDGVNAGKFFLHQIVK